MSASKERVEDTFWNSSSVTQRPVHELIDHTTYEFSPSPKMSHLTGKGKGKSIPLQAWTGPEDSRRLKFPDFKTIGT